MDFASAIASINYPGVLLAALSFFLLGGLWYSPALFGKQWMTLNAFSGEDLKSDMRKIFGISFVLALLAAFALAMFVGPEAGTADASAAGFMAGLFWVSASFGIVYLFERKPIGLFLINAGYITVAFTIMGFIIGLV